MNFTHVRIWAGEWRCESLFCQFSFVSKKIDQEGAITTRPDDDIGLQVAWPSPPHTSLPKHRDCELSHKLVSDSTRNRSINSQHRPAHRRSPTSGLVRQGDGHATWDLMPSSGRVVLAPSWSIFSQTKENWQERLSQRHSPAQIVTLCEVHFPVEFPFKQ